MADNNLETAICFNFILLAESFVPKENMKWLMVHPGQTSVWWDRLMGDSKLEMIAEFVWTHILYVVWPTLIRILVDRDSNC